MKRFVLLLLIASILICSVFSLTSCAKRIPKGTYISENRLATITIKGNKLHYSGPVDSVMGADFGNIKYDATYRISDDTIFIKRDKSSTESFESFSMGDGYIVISGVKYIKAD